MKLGRNDQCWCGSGKKYKKCHLDRENQPAARPLAGLPQIVPAVAPT
jgi:SEC-C motif